MGLATAMREMDGDGEGTFTKFIFNSTHRVVVFLQCKTCVAPGRTSIERHLRRHPHSLLSDVLKSTTEYLHSLDLKPLAELHAHKPAAQCMAIKHPKVINECMTIHDAFARATVKDDGDGEKGKDKGRGERKGRSRERVEQGGKQRERERVARERVEKGGKQREGERERAREAGTEGSEREWQGRAWREAGNG